MTSEMTDIVKHHPGVIGGEAEIAQLPKPMLPHSAYRQHVPLARGIVAEYQKSYEDLRDETNNTDMWGIAEELLRTRIADSIERAILAERERCAKFGDAWDNPSALRLAAGEMTAQEMRTARAVARGIAAAIRQQATP